jgi:selenocysteine lyase/cysteine desulfurase
VYPWLELRRRGIRIAFVKSVNGFFDIGNFERAITKRTRILALSQVQYFNGYKVDVETVSAICHKNDIFLVLDCIQAAGCEPIELGKWHIAVASAGGQKWMLSSQGTGLFYVSEEIRERLQPPWRSWLSVDWKCQWHDLRKFDLEYPGTAAQYELGTYPGPLIMSFDWALNFIARLGIRNIQRHNHALTDVLIDYLDAHPMYRITSTLKKNHRSSILSFTTDTVDIGFIHRQLSQEKIVTGLREGAIRISVHLYNSKDDIKRLIAALDKAAYRAGKEGG